MAKIVPRTIGESLYWSYANLAMRHAMLEQGSGKPGIVHYMIRSRLYAGLCKGTLTVGDYFDDEKIKLTQAACCWYCGSTHHLSADHIIPRQKGGRDGGENLVYACRSCNSSKGAKDLLEWTAARGNFPSLFVLRRYLKMAIEYCQEQQLLKIPLDEAEDLKTTLPFALDALPQKYPAANELVKMISIKSDQP